MEKAIVGFSKKGLMRVKINLAAYLNPELLKDINFDAWVNDIYERVSDRIEGVHEPEFEIPAKQSASGNPVHLGFSADDFDYILTEDFI